MGALTTQQHVPSVFTAALFFGVYISTLFSCIRWLVWDDGGWRIRKKIHWTTLSVALLLFACALVNISLTLRGLMIEVNDPIIHPKPTPRSGKPDHSWEAIVECTLSNVSALAADGVLIYRCWLVYERSLRIVIFPILMWICGVICTILQLYWQAIQAKGLLTAWQPVNTTIGPGTVLIPFWGSTILLNAFATVAISARLWKIARDSERVTSVSSIKFLTRVMTESGVLYLVITTAHFIVWFTPSAFAISVVSNINLPIIGITYNLIIIRTSQAKAKETQSFNAARPASPIQFGNSMTFTKTLEIQSGNTDMSGDTLANTSKP
ncbi:hypothetical protein M422DRAFT_31552 [Sphaerobolus stellatus SS14]|uniref:Uncharacterized protein n=1 Tax=Sphaerobolus stellatus (strain SS14) TaxID=990650 RepID=A0A0C9V522_SPHS4|nr:hypothetical protein M422DRAFT_31552 [Sphaerobolus stellatus SS14]